MSSLCTVHSAVPGPSRDAVCCLHPQSGGGGGGFYVWRRLLSAELVSLLLVTELVLVLRKSQPFGMHTQP